MTVSADAATDQPRTGTCRDCGTTFQIPRALRERHPGWVPPRCSSCHRGTSTRGASGRPGRSASDAGPQTGVFTDGSASPNPGPGGWGVVWVVDGEVVDEAAGTDPDTTNNRMELEALIRAVELVPEGTEVTLYSDSNLAVRTMNEWAAGWKRRGWKRKRGPVENLDLVRPLYEALQARPELTLAWIKAHAGHTWNEWADDLATGTRMPGAPT